MTGGPNDGAAVIAYLPTGQRCSYKEYSNVSPAVRTKLLKLKKRGV